MYESGDGDGGIAAGTIVVSIDRGFSLDADSADEAERRLHEGVIAGKLPGGRVYKISPADGNAELIRTVAFCENGNGRHVILEPAMGMYSEFRRLRYVEETPAPHAAAQEQWCAT
jgi:hypothetical protein